MDGPLVLPQDVTVPRGLELTVDSPSEVEVGKHITFSLTLHNAESEPQRDVVIESAFDEALIFPDRDEKMARQTVGALPPGESRELALTLYSETPGRHCCRFTVTAEGREKLWKSVCVTVRSK